MFVCDDDIIEKFAINHSEDNCQGHRADIKDVKTFVGWLQTDCSDLKACQGGQSHP